MAQIRCLRCQARVVRVLDGDTVSVTAAREGDPEIHLRLLGIDAPEKSQLYGAEATAVMKGLLSRSHVILVEATGLDKYRRTLANIYSFRVTFAPLWTRKAGKI